MRKLKGNIYVAKLVCILSLLFFICILFLSENRLYEIGTNIENFFNFHTDINVLTMQSFLTAISSGIFASTLVAWVFYKLEFITTILELTHQASLFFRFQYQA